MKISNYEYGGFVEDLFDRNCQVLEPRRDWCVWKLRLFLADVYGKSRFKTSDEECFLLLFAQSEESPTPTQCMHQATKPKTRQTCRDMTCAVHAVILLLAAMLTVTSLLLETDPPVISYKYKTGLTLELGLLYTWSRLAGVEIKEHAQKKE